MDAPWQPYGDGVDLALGDVERYLGITLPVHRLAFCFAFLVAFWQIGMASDRTAMNDSNPRETNDACRRSALLSTQHSCLCLPL